MTVPRSTLFDDQPLQPRLTYSVSDEKVRLELGMGDATVEHIRRRAGSLVDSDGFAEWWGSYIRGARPAPVRGLTQLRFIDLFSSVGGLSLGAMEAAAVLGMRGIPLLAADVDERALQVYRSNLRPREVAADSVRGMFDFRISGSGDHARFAYDPEAVDPRVATLKGSVDLILAGPPCQGHSSLNNHSRHEDPKNLLYLTVPAAAVALDVKHVVIENVPNVVADRHGVVHTTLGLLRDAGYRVSYGVVAADQVGWAQSRRRFFLVASKETEPLDVIELQRAASHAALPVSWLLDDLAEQDLDDDDVMRSVPKLSEENDKRVNWLHDNDEYDLPNELRPECHQQGTTYFATYGRMHRDRPAPTITGGFLSPGRGRFVHPSRRRVLTPREAARVQGFPDWFDFVSNPANPPSRTELGRWIGNAVPSVLGFLATLSALGGAMKSSSILEGSEERAS